MHEINVYYWAKILIHRVEKYTWNKILQGHAYNAGRRKIENCHLVYDYHRGYTNMRCNSIK